jgi:pSer/pThr/pTyr-binding forkhead associated (FHA) protein
LLGGVGLVIMSLGKKEPYLEVVDGLDKGKRYPLEQEVVRIGAIAEDGEAKNDIVLRDIDRMVSRFHCEIHRRQNKLFLVDVNSANGTYVDKRSIAPGKPVRLKKGSIMALGGSCTLRVGFEKKKKKD